MREVPLTDRQKTEKGLYGSYAPRVRGREVAAQSKDGSQTRRGGAAMNSTATELEFTRRRAMRGIVKGFVIGILGLAGLLVPVGYVHALDSKESCGQQGFILCKDGACGSRKCWCNNKVLTPGETCSNTLAGKTYFYYCDGCSGKVISVIKPKTPQRTRPGLVPQGQLTPTTPTRRVAPPAGGTLQK
jgi:hypothetical protein